MRMWADNIKMVSKQCLIVQSRFGYFSGGATCCKHVTEPFA